MTCAAVSAMLLRFLAKTGAHHSLNSTRRRRTPQCFMHVAQPWTASVVTISGD